MEKSAKKKVAFICVHNSCRSQIAEALGRAFDDNWGLEDPTGKSDEEFKIIIQEVENKILQLKNELSIMQKNY